MLYFCCIFSWFVGLILSLGFVFAFLSYLNSSLDSERSVLFLALILLTLSIALTLAALCLVCDGLLIRNNNLMSSNSCGCSSCLWCQNSSSWSLWKNCLIVKLNLIRIWLNFIFRCNILAYWFLGFFVAVGLSEYNSNEAKSD